MSDGTVKVTAEAHLHITQLNSLQAQLSDLLSQITSHGLALTDPNVWAGPAASVFANNVWPSAQTQLDQVRGVLADLQGQVGQIVNNITAAGGGLPVVGSIGSLPVVGGLVGGLTGGL